MKIDVNQNLNQLLLDLEDAIGQAIQNPLLLADGPLRQVESTCTTLQANLGAGFAGTLSREERVESERLTWLIRARSGRLRLLLDSAARFYSTCFSTSQSQGLAYGAHGEWGAEECLSHLALDC